MKEFYTRQEVAELLGISKATVYHYAKQKKIKKIHDPHRIIREARYEPKEVLELAEERKRNQPTGIRPSKLAKKLGVSVQKIYALINENNLEVDVIPVGDERTIYSIPEDKAQWIEKELVETAPLRGTRLEYYEPNYDVALYQKFQAPSGQVVRITRNKENEWGFELSSRSWISIEQGRMKNQFKPAYSIHHKSGPLKGYTDFELPIDSHHTYDFLDFVYQTWGVENIRLREHETFLALSVKSRKSISIPTTLDMQAIVPYIVSGKVYQLEETWIFESGYTRTTVEIPSKMADDIREIAKKRDISMSEVVELALAAQLDSLKL